MRDRVSITETKAQFSRLVARAEAGEEITITRSGRPVAVLVPLSDPGRSAANPAVPLFESGQPDLAQTVDSALGRFGES